MRQGAVVMSRASSHVNDTKTREYEQSANQQGLLFKNPFHIEDLTVFDDATMQRLLSEGGFGFTLDDVAHSLRGASKSLVRCIQKNVPRALRSSFMHELRQPVLKEDVKAARRRVLDGLFWELTYWKTPELYEELTEGEQLHPGIFQQLGPELRGKAVLDAGAGSGRASFECLRHGVRVVFAVEPSPGLLHILEQKLTDQPESSKIIPLRGRFDRIPLDDHSVDMTISCSAFTAEPEQGGEVGLAELLRVTKPGGKIILIWPRAEDRDWLTAHGFQYVSLPMRREMRVHFRSLRSALRCARLFYAHNKAVASYITKRRKPEVPFSVLGFNPPRDYCWLVV